MPCGAAYEDETHFPQLTTMSIIDAADSAHFSASGEEKPLIANLLTLHVVAVVRVVHLGLNMRQ